MKWLWLALGGLSLAACSGSGSGGGEAPAPVALVTLAPVVGGAISASTTIYGAAEASPGAKLALVAPAEGLLVSVDAPPGTPVRAGQVVARLAPSPTTRVDLGKAASDARAADLALARAQRLRNDGLGSDAEVETARAAARSAGLIRASLAARSGGLILRAPAAGIVDGVTPSPGELVQAGGAVASIQRGGDVRARFGVDPAAARALHVGMPLRIAAVPGRPPLTVPIESVSPALDPATRLGSVFAVLPRTSGIAAGQTLTATVATAGTSGLSVPYAALLDDAGQSYVFVVAAGVAHRRDVAVGAADGDRVALASGVRAGEQVVVAGGTAIEDGMKVRTR